MVQQRRQRLAEIIQEAIIGVPKNDWFTLSCQEILRWDGDELHDDIIALLDHESPTVQFLVAKVLEERPEGVSVEVLLTKLNSSDAAVAYEILVSACQTAR